MRPVAVVVHDELVDHGFEVTSADDEHAIKALPSDSADEAFSEGVGTRSSDRRADDPNALGAEDLVEAGRELGVPVADQEPDRLRALGEFMGEIPGLLGHPGTCWMRRHSRHEDLPGVEFDEEQTVEHLQEHGVHGEEVAGQ